MSISLKQFAGATVTPADDAKLYNFLLSGKTGIIEGAEVTHLGSNQLKISSGWGVCCGRVFVIEEETVNAKLSTDGTIKGRLLINIDVTADTPASFITQAAATLPALKKQDINSSGTVHQIPLVTYSVSETQCSNLTDARTMIQKSALKMTILSAMTDLGLEATATFADTVAAVPGYTKVFLQPNSLTDASWKLPISQGYIEITRRYGTRQVSVLAYSSLGEIYLATIDENGSPTGDWNKVIKQTGGTFKGDMVARSENREGFVVRNCGVVDKNTNLVSTNRIRFMRK